MTDYVYRPRKFSTPLRIKRTEIKIISGPPATGKSVRAEEWRREAPHNRRVTESWLEAENLMNEGYEVVLTTNDPTEGIKDETRD